MAKANKRRQIMSDDVLLTRIKAKVSDSTGWPGSPISLDNEKVINYYNSILPKRQSKGRSSYVSSDVYDAVEQMKAQLLETFSAGREIVRFNAYNIEDTEQARIETKYVDHVVFSLNDGFTVFHDVIHDGLTARKGVAEVAWDEDYTYDTNTVDGLSQEEAIALASDPDVDELELDLDEDTGTYSGSYVTKFDQSKVVIDPVPPEEYFVERGVKKRTDGIRGRRKLVTRADLIDMGYPKEKVDKVKWDEEGIKLAPEKLARERPAAGLDTLGDNPLQEELTGVILYTAYVKLVMYRGEKACLWRIVYASDVVFEKDRVDEDPFLEFDPLRVPHTVWGNNYAGRVAQTQNARTVLTRGILDHTAITLNPRWGVVQGGLVNPKEMLDNRLGGIVNMTRPDAVAPFVYPNLNPFVYQTLEMLKHNKEEQTGISALSQGMNKDAISKQNSQALIDNMITVSQIRQKIMARFFATSFLIPLYQKVWKLVAKYQKKEDIIPVTGGFQTVDPKKWRNPRTCWLSPHLGYGEAEKEAKKYAEAYNGLSTDPASPQFFLPPYRYALLGDTFEKNGIKNWRDYIPPPDKWQTPQPDPNETKKADAAMTQAQASMVSAQATSKKVDIGEHREALRTQNDTAKLVADTNKQVADTERQNLETVNRVDVEQRKMALEEHMRPKEHDAQKAQAAQKAQQANAG